MFDYYLLKPYGDPIFTNASRLLPVRHNGEAAMLKIAMESEEKFGSVLMAWWDSHGAARVIAGAMTCQDSSIDGGIRPLSTGSRRGGGGTP